MSGGSPGEPIPSATTTRHKWWLIQRDAKGGHSKFEQSMRKLVAGGGAGAIAKTCVAPLERLKMLLQIQGMRGLDLGLVATFRRVLQLDGARGFWKGNAANVVRIIPNKGIAFMCNDLYRDMFHANQAVSNSEKFMKNVASGALAGCTTTVCTYPLDLIRSRLIAQEGPRPMYTGIMDCGRQSYQAEGIRGLYRGIGPTLCGIVPYLGISFAVFPLIKGMFPPSNDSKLLDGVYSCLAGGFAGLVSQSASYPIDTVRRRMQLQGVVGEGVLYKNSIHCFKQIVAKEGALTLYKGISANMLRCIPNQAIQFTAFLQLKQALGLMD